MDRSENPRESADENEADRHPPPGRAPFEVGQFPFLDLLGVQSIEVLRGWCRVELPVSRRHLRGKAIVHGGAVATLLDSAMGLAACTSTPPGQGLVTVQLNANFIRPAKEGDSLVATGELTHSGRRTAVAFGEVRTAEGVLVASGSATFVHLACPDSGAEGTLPTRP